MLEAHDDALARVLARSVEHAIRTATGGPDAGQIATQWLAEVVTLRPERRTADRGDLEALHRRLDEVETRVLGALERLR